MRIISGIYKRRRFDVPKNIKARPTTDFARENLFNVLNNMIDFEDIRSALDLFAGTGAISFELLSRGCHKVVCVEKVSLQYDFIKKVKQELKDENLITVKGNALKYIETTHEKFDFIFADPPYDLPELPTIPDNIFKHGLLNKGGWFIFEHSKNNDFSEHPYFVERRVYGSVNFSFFHIPEDEEKETSTDNQ
ncbi:MAG: RsmD family RNA methyltransferase [Bacteroidales bacterium]